MKSLAVISPLKKLSIPVWHCATLALCTGLAMALAVMPLVSAQDMPTAEEMQEMMQGMQEMQEEMDNLDPELREKMEEMMANPPVKSAADDGAEPVRDAAKLAAVPTEALDADELKAYVEALQPKLTAAIPADARTRADRINSELAKTGDYLPQLRAAANGLAAWGALPEATWLMGKLTLASGSVQDLSNLAAFLSMQRAETAALPILYTLNARYPNNSTLLNNLGQARYGLGDIAEAEKYLTAAVQITPLHPQANMTVARIQMARGNNQAAQASLHKALQGGFSDAKEEQLRKAGGELNKDDVRWRRPMPQEPLGLERFVVPEYPTRAAELVVADPQWRAFRNMTGGMVISLDEQAQQFTDSIDSSSPAALLDMTVSAASLPFALKASTLMGFVTEQFQLEAKSVLERQAIVMQSHGAALAELREKIFAIKVANGEKFPIKPEGYDCPEIMAEIDNYLAGHNREYEQLNRSWLNSYRRFLNETTYLAQYTSPSTAMFEATKLGAKSGYAKVLRDLPVALVDGLIESETECFNDTGTKPMMQTKLSDFQCEYISTLNLPRVGSIVSRCNVTEVNFDPIFAPFKASWTAEIDDHNTNHLTRASAQVTIEGVTVGGHSEFDTDGVKSGGISVGAGTDLGPKLKGGPLEIGVEVGVTMGMEFDRSGITDVSVSAGVESSSTSTIGDTGMAKSEAGVTAGANSTWSWNSGFGGDVSAGFDSSVF